MFSKLFSGLGIIFFVTNKELFKFLIELSPASTAAFTAPISPVTVITTFPPPTIDFSKILTLADLSMASAPIIDAVIPLVSIIPIASIFIPP